MNEMGESKEFVMELWAKYDSFFDGYHIKKKEEIVITKQGNYPKGILFYAHILHMMKLITTSFVGMQSRRWMR